MIKKSYEIEAWADEGIMKISSIDDDGFITITDTSQDSIIISTDEARELMQVLHDIFKGDDLNEN